MNEDIKTLQQALRAKGLILWTLGSDLLLIPKDMLTKVPHGTTLTSIYGEQGTKGRTQLDTGSHSHLLNFGILPSQYEQAMEWFK